MRALFASAACGSLAFFGAACSHAGSDPKPRSGEPEVVMVRRADAGLPPSTPHGSVDAQGVYASTWFGLRARTPEGFKASTSPGSEVVLQREGTSPAVAALVSVPNLASPEAKENLFKATVGELMLQMGRGQQRAISEVNRGKAKLAIGEAEEREYEIPDTPFHLRVLLVPLCDEHSGLMFINTWTDDTGRSGIETWLRSFEKLTSDPPACQGHGAEPPSHER